VDTYSVTVHSRRACHKSRVLVQTLDVRLERFDLLLEMMMSLQQILPATYTITSDVTTIQPRISAITITTTFITMQHNTILALTTYA